MKIHLRNILAVLLAITLLLSMCACGAKEDTSATNKETESTEQIEATEDTTPQEGTEPPKPSDTESGVGGKGENENGETTPSTPSGDKDTNNGTDEESTKPTTPPTTDPPATEPPTTNPPVTTEPPTTDPPPPPPTDPPTTDPTDPPSTEPEETRPPVVVDPPLTEPPEPETPTVNVTKEQVNQIKAYFLELVNYERGKKGAGALTTNYHLSSCAQTRSAEAVINWSHTRPNGAPFHSIIDMSQYPYATVGENLCMTSHVGTNSYTSKDAWTGSDEQIYDAACWIFTGFKNSSAHYSSMINPDFKDTGIGISYIIDEATGIPYFYVAHLFGSL